MCIRDRNHCLCWLNRLIYIAVDREILRGNPIEDVAYERKETDVYKRQALSRENFEKLRDLEIPEKRRSHIITKDLFLFACYTYVGCL